METLSLSVQTRESQTKAKHLLRQGLVPGILYGKGIKNIAVQVAAAPMDKIFKQAGYSTLIDLAIDGKKHTALIHDVDRDPLAASLRHIDFYQVKLDEKIQSEIPLTFIGEAAAVKELEGTLLTNKDIVQIEALPQDLVHEIVVDISQLKTFDDVVYVKNIGAPPGIAILDNPDDVVALVQPPRSEKELAELEQKIEEKVEEVKVEEKGKKEEEGETAGGEKTAEDSEKKAS